MTFPRAEQSGALGEAAQRRGVAVAARLANGVRVVGMAAGSAFALVRDEVEELLEVDAPVTCSQFRSRDAFPAAARAAPGTAV